MNQNIEIIITGDFVPVISYVDLDEHKLFEYLYDKELLKQLHEVDLSITNLEVPLTTNLTSIIKSGPNLCAPPENIRFIKNGGFQLVTLANNHMMDYDTQGLEETISICHNYDIKTVGAGLVEEEAKKTLFLEIKGKKIAFINVAENEFLFSKTSSAQVHNFNLVDVYLKIEEARNISDFVFLIYHGGVEHFQLPYPQMRKNLRFMAKAGANAIVCHHTHCYSGYEIINETPIFYGLGNFFAERKSPLLTWFEGFMLRFTLKQDLSLEFKLIPYTQSINNVGVRLLNSVQNNEFSKKINSLNNILSNPELYNSKWNEYIKTVTPKLIRQIYPIGFLSNEMKNFKRHAGSKKIKYLLNLVRTESSQSCLLKALEDIY